MVNESKIVILWEHILVYATKIKDLGKEKGKQIWEEKKTQRRIKTLGKDQGKNVGGA